MLNYAFSTSPQIISLTLGIMKKIKLLSISILLFCFISFSCSSSDEEADVYCGTKVVSDQSVDLWLGPRGGCFYYNVNNNKTYVDRSECNC